jgi:pyruvate dehydrogenase phosphatase
MGLGVLAASQALSLPECEAAEYPTNSDHITHPCSCGKKHIYGFKSFKMNQIDARGEVIQSESNDPCEDTFNTVQLSRKFNGIYVGVFDGHGGWQVAKSC